MRQSSLYWLIALLLVLCGCRPVAPDARGPVSPAPSPTVSPTLVPVVRTTAPPSPVPATPTLLPPGQNKMGGFPFPAGTTWVYSRTEYSQVGSAPPLTIITGTSLITNTVVQSKIIQGTTAMQFMQTANLVQADPGWVDNSANLQSVSWYQVVGAQVYSAPQEPTSAEPPRVDFKGEPARTLVYEFPLAEGNSWCPAVPAPSYNPDCVSMGRRRVVWTGRYATPVSTFDECYMITQEYNSGGVTEWFCSGVGVVARKYDHGGTRFGFEDVLIRYTRPPP